MAIEIVDFPIKNADFLVQSNLPSLSARVQLLIYWRVKLRPGPACCPELYRDVPGKFHDDDDDVEV